MSNGQPSQGALQVEKAVKEIQQEKHGGAKRSINITLTELDWSHEDPMQDVVKLNS